MKQEYDFPVVLQDIFIETSHSPMREVHKRKAVVRQDTGEVLSIVSDKYKLLPHKVVVESFRSAIPYDFKETIKLTNGGAKMFVIYKVPSVKFDVGRDDSYCLQFIVKNSYDGTNALQIVFGAFRFVCENGMFIGQKFFSYTQKHIGSVQIDHNALTDSIASMTSQFKETLPILQNMSDRDMERDVDEIFGSSKALNLPAYLVKEAQVEYERAGNTSVLGFYNSLTKAITHNMRKDSPQVRLSYGQVAWGLAKGQLK